MMQQSYAGGVAIVSGRWFDTLTVYIVVILCVFMLGVYVNGHRIIDQRLVHGDTSVVVQGDVREADHPFRLTRLPKSVTLCSIISCDGDRGPYARNTSTRNCIQHNFV